MPAVPAQTSHGYEEKNQEICQIRRSQTIVSTSENRIHLVPYEPDLIIWKRDLKVKQTFSIFDKLYVCISSLPFPCLGRPIQITSGLQLLMSKPTPVVSAQVRQRTFEYFLFFKWRVSQYGSFRCRAFAGPRRERKGFLVAFDGRTSSYRTRRNYTINSIVLISAHTNAQNTKLKHYSTGVSICSKARMTSGWSTPAVGNW